MQNGVEGVPVERLFLLDGLQDFVREFLEELKIVGGAEDYL